VGIDQPLRTPVVEVGQSALAQDRVRRDVLREDSIRIAGYDLRRDLEQVAWVEPRVSQVIKFLGRA
jgi:hypothetical protein